MFKKIIKFLKKLFCLDYKECYQEPKHQEKSENSDTSKEKIFEDIKTFETLENFETNRNQEKSKDEYIDLNEIKDDLLLNIKIKDLEDIKRLSEKFEIEVKESYIKENFEKSENSETSKNSKNQENLETSNILEFPKPKRKYTKRKNCNLGNTENQEKSEVLEFPKPKRKYTKRKK